MRWFLLIVAMLVGAGLVYKLSLPVVSWHQKLTLTIETPSGPVTASSVTSLRRADRGKLLALPDAGPLSSRFHGEAVVADLGGGRYLFALLGRQDQLAQKAFPDVMNTPEGRASWPQWAREIARLRGARRLSPDLYPLLVTFADIDDPTTVKRVDPANLAATFGPGYTLASISFEITDEPVTEGRVEKFLPWLPGLDGGYLHGGFTSKGAPLGLHAGDFVSGE